MSNKTTVDDNATENLIHRVRQLKSFDLSNKEIGEKIVAEGIFSPEAIWLACKSADILDKEA